MTALQAAAPPIEFGQIAFVANISCLYPTYVRGGAYLASGQGKEAAAEFQKIIDHSGIVWNCWTGALVHLGVVRANALQSRTSQGAPADAARVRALAAYKDFLTLALQEERWVPKDPRFHSACLYQWFGFGPEPRFSGRMPQFGSIWIRGYVIEECIESSGCLHNGT